MPAIVVEHQRVNYVMHGQGPEVLLIHGWVSSLRMWARTAGRLAQAGYRATAIDLLGFGDSDKPPTGWYTLDNYTSHLIALCQSLGLERPVIVGHSMGGTLALSLAAQMAVRAVVACAPVVNGQLGGSMHLLLRSSTTRQMWRWMQAQPFFPKIGAMNMPAAPGLMRDPVRRRNQEDLRRATVNATFGSLKTVVDQSLEDRLRDITAPTLILIGGRDFTVPPAQGKVAARLMRNVQLVEWPTVGHSMIDDRPDEFDRLLMDFVRQSQSIQTS